MCIRLFFKHGHDDIWLLEIYGEKWMRCALSGGARSIKDGIGRNRRSPGWWMICFSIGLGLAISMHAALSECRHDEDGFFDLSPRRCTVEEERRGEKKENTIDMNERFFPISLNIKDWGVLVATE